MKTDKLILSCIKQLIIVSFSASHILTFVHPTTPFCTTSNFIRLSWGSRPEPHCPSSLKKKSFIQQNSERYMKWAFELRLLLHLCPPWLWRMQLPHKCRSVPSLSYRLWTYESLMIRRSDRTLPGPTRRVGWNHLMVEVGKNWQWMILALAMMVDMDMLVKNKAAPPWTVPAAGPAG